MNAPRNGTSETATLNRAHERLKCLYEISKRLARFESIARTVPEVLALISESVAMRTAILIIEEPGAPRLPARARSFGIRGVSAPRLRAAKAHARSYAYLARASDVEEEAGRHPSILSASEPERSGFLLLPLVVDQAKSSVHCRSKRQLG
jgi:nitrate/nitrite-specific signal transduction histidine kinase